MVDLLTGKHPDPDALTFSEFLCGYVVVSIQCDTADRPHRDAVLLEIVQDSRRYKWEAIRAAHFAFLEKIEQETCQWSDVAVRQELRMLLIWDHRLAPARAVSAAASTSSNNGTTKSKPHCSYCFLKTSRKLSHSLAQCNRKIKDNAAPSGN